MCAVGEEISARTDRSVALSAGAVSVLHLQNGWWEIACPGETAR